MLSNDNNILNIINFFFLILCLNIIIPSIVEHIKRSKISEMIISNFLNTSIIPDLEKLGLSDLIPKLQQAINKIYVSPREVTFDDDIR